MRLRWSYDIGGIGKTYGYAKANRELRAAVLRAGAELRDDDNAPVALAFAPAHLYQRRPNPVNVLFTMFEADRLPPEFLAGARLADRLIVPCAHNQRALAGYNLDSQVCPLGFDPAAFPYRERASADYADATDFNRRNRRNLRISPRFRFLWLGAPDVRKGWDIAVAAFQAEFRPWEPVELYVKTTAAAQDQHLASHGGKVHFDGRNLDESSIRLLYESAQAFVFPSRGEGFGLTALEAMASGCLVIAPSHTGLAEFVTPRTAFVVSTRRRQAEYGVPIVVDEPDPRHLRRLMRRAYADYAATRELRAQAAALARWAFTWDHAALRLIEILQGWNDPQIAQMTPIESAQSA
ncbi:MAG: glycosyltransferase family 4 protein [Candidatus Tectomicrobia bacterium]|nr:glycosyltransferase family 4 protein [Candidatus Tectomicrobia bacterium]